MRGGVGRRNRRKSAYSLLERELKRETKPKKIDGRTTKNMIPLSEFDKKRISKDMKILSDRIK
jgi:hypothetical protein